MPNIIEMRSFVKSKYDRLYSRGGAKVSVDKAPDAQIVATYHSIKAQEHRVAERAKATTYVSNKQYVWTL